MYCRTCGNQLKEGDKFCPKCGTSIEEVHVVTSKKHFIKLILFLICTVGICISVISLLKGINNNSGIADENENSPLLEQLEGKYGLDISEIKAAGGNAVDNVILEDYLPRVDVKRLTTVLNSADNTENILEEMTIGLPDGNGGYPYSVYNYLADFTVQGVISPGKYEEYYSTKQENLLNKSAIDMNFYIGLPGKNWTLEKEHEDTTIKMFMAPEYYTVTTPHGTYENCLLKYEYTSSSVSSWANSHSFTAYAPYGVGKVYSIVFSEDSPEEPLIYYTYIPE